MSPSPVSSRVKGKMMGKHPYTDNQFKVLAAAFRGNFNTAQFDSKAARTRAANDMISAKLVSGNPVEGGDLTPAGMRAYADMCQRYDADSGCEAYARRAFEAKCALRNIEAGQA